MEANIHGLYEKFKAGDLIATHEGGINPKVIDDFLAKTEDTLNNIGENPKKIRKVYNIVVEAIQNLFHHQTVPPADFIKNMGLDGDKYSFCTMVKEGMGYKIITGNFVNYDVARQLKQRIEQLNSLSHEELKNLYKIVLDNNEFTEKGGGGLGFIEMARKSGNKFVYDFVKYDDKYKFFVLEVLVN
ncbi:MAG: SiaB family protein kinase [Bacteroidales bacterium]|nr:SiaB family protein kinase [Bacteroidales bacterium]